MKGFLRLAIFLVTVSMALTGWAASSGTCANFAAGSCPSSVPAGVNTFYFIDYANGSDSNSGTTESSPWKHAPGFANATGNAAAHTPAAGEGWIFKGGVTVDANAWPAFVPYGGTASNPTYIGVDPGWYAGSGWSRPIFNGGGASGYDASSYGLLTDAKHHTSYFVIDNIEFTGLYWTSSSGNSDNYAFTYVGAYAFIGDKGWEAKNLYVHGWSHAKGAYDPAAFQRLVGLPWDATPGNQSSFHDSVVDGSDSSQDCCGASGAAITYNNYYSYLVDGYNSGLTANGTMFFHDNHITLPVMSSTGVHENCFQLYAYNGNQSGGTAIVYNNHLDCPYIGTAAEVLFFETIGVTGYVFNNVARFGQPAGVSLGGWSSSTASNTFYVFNNTIQAYNAAGTPTNTCFTPNFNTVSYLSANFCVTNNGNSPSYNTYEFSGGRTTFVGPTFSITCNGGAQTNLGMSQICAPIGSGDGTGNLNATQTYPFAPMDSTAAAKVKTGPNNSSYCSAISAIDSAAGNACLHDTTLGVSYNTSSHTVTYPAHSPAARPTGGAAWSNGAYELPGSTVVPPTNLAGKVS